MANTTHAAKVPKFVRLGNMVTLALLRAGVRLVGPGMIVGEYPMYLLTVRGRKSGQPRTVAVAIMQQQGNRYIGSPYGIVDWVRNLRAAGEAVMTRGRRAETVAARELSPAEAVPLLRQEIDRGNPFMRFYGVTRDSAQEELERTAIEHPLFQLQAK
ncbi:MAG: nitroreductase family deazaflavin-dependent oxidoreductase [Nitrososphaerota archaeon]